MLRLGRICSRNKKGVSVIIGYVLLISMAMALSVLVYNWLRFYVDPPETISCPEGVSIIIKDYNCSGSKINVNFQNKGLFTIDGFIFRVNDRENATVGLYDFDYGSDVANGVELKPGDQTSIEYDYSRITDKTLKKVTIIEALPYVSKQGDERVFCDEVASQEVDC